MAMFTATAKTVDKNPCPILFDIVTFSLRNGAKPVGWDLWIFILFNHKKKWQFRVFGKLFLDITAGVAHSGHEK